MNTLSWLLYFADVVADLESFSLFSLIALVLSGIIMLLVAANHYCEKEAKVLAKKGVHKFILALIPALFITLTPSKTTIYFIAASEMGEQVIKSDTMKMVETYLVDLLSSETSDEN